MKSRHGNRRVSRVPGPAEAGSLAVVSVEAEGG